MSALWSTEQQAWLKALGHRVMVLAGDEAAFDASLAFVEGVADAQTVSARGAAPSRASERAATKSFGSPEPRMAVGEGADRRVPTPARAPAIAESPIAARRPPASAVPGDALERALLSATGQRTRSEARDVLERLGVDTAALRGDAAGKRALWQQLRPLRPRFRA